jgi:hypothetical protein
MARRLAASEGCLPSPEASKRLLERKVAATQMRGWGADVADRYLRFVFSNEPVERLMLLGERAAMPSPDQRQASGARA